MSRPQNSCQPLPKPQNSKLGPQKVKNDPKIKSTSKVRIERNIEQAWTELGQAQPILSPVEIKSCLNWAEVYFVVSNCANYTSINFTVEF